MRLGGHKFKGGTNLVKCYICIIALHGAET